MRQLYDYFRSSASYRVRIALRLKDLPYEAISVSLLDKAQRSPEYMAHNPQGLVPTLLENETVLTQSLAICEYLDEVYPTNRLLPVDPLGRAQVRSLAYSIASDIHPLNNLRVLRYLEDELGVQPAQKNAWYRHWIELGFTAFEQQLKDVHGLYCFGDSVTLADICLVPQVYNARRFNCDLDAFPTITTITQRCLALEAFSSTSPESQPQP